MDTEIKRLTEFKDFQWNTLIHDIADGRVVPIVGPELLCACENGKEVPFYSKVVNELADYFSLPRIEGETLSDLVSRIDKEIRVSPDDVRNVLSDKLGEMKEPQEILGKLVAIPYFRLFLTTTPDSQLMDALAQGEGACAMDFFFSRNYPGDGDIPAQVALSGTTRYVYHLFGGARSGTHYAMTEDDKLDYVCRWMNMENKPRNLISQLAEKRLLVLGCGYENWLTRFFLFGLKGTYLFYNDMRNPASSLLADRHSSMDVQLDRFLSRCRGNIYCRGDSAHFVNELYARWEKSDIPPVPAPAPAFKPQSIFISYAHEDLESAERIKKALEDAGLDVWLDKRNLDSGIGFDEQIAKSIQDSSFFLPVLSRVSAKIGRRYFRREWRFAFDEATFRTPRFPFIHPIAVDDVEPCNDLPRQMNELHWIRAAGGIVPVDDLGKLVNVFRSGNGK